MSVLFPPTVVIRSRAENPKKCSILPLRSRPDLVFLHYPSSELLPDLTGYVRLAIDGPELSSVDVDSGLLLLDGSWRRAAVMVQAFEQIPPRSLQGIRTAYPRTSRLGTDPDNGLASVEAVYVAYHRLGRPTDGLLDHYRWKDEFLRLNSKILVGA